MAKSLILVVFLGVASITLQAALADEIDDIIKTSIDSTLGELGALTRLTGVSSNPYGRYRYTPLPYRNNYGVKGIFGGGSAHIENLPDLVNLVFGLGGHIVGRAGWIIHDAIRSMFDGLMTSEFKLRSGGTPTMFGFDEDEILEDTDALFGSLGTLGTLGTNGIANPNVYGGVPTTNGGILNF